MDDFGGAPGAEPLEELEAPAAGVEVTCPVCASQLSVSPEEGTAEVVGGPDLAEAGIAGAPGFGFEPPGQTPPRGPFQRKGRTPAPPPAMPLP